MSPSADLSSAVAPHVQVLVRVIDMPLPASVVSQAVFLPDNRTAAVLSDDGRVVFLTAAAGTCRALLEVSTSDKVRGIVDMKATAVQQQSQAQP